MDINWIQHAFIQKAFHYLPRLMGGFQLHISESVSLRWALRSAVPGVGYESSGNWNVTMVNDVTTIIHKMMMSKNTYSVAWENFGRCDITIVFHIYPYPYWIVCCSIQGAVDESGKISVHQRESICKIMMSKVTTWSKVPHSTVYVFRQQLMVLNLNSKENAE